MAGWCLGVMVVLLGPDSGTGRSILSSRAASWVARALVCAGTVIAAVAAAVTARSMFEAVMAVVLPLLTVLRSCSGDAIRRLWVHRLIGVMQREDGCSCRLAAVLA